MRALPALLMVLILTAKVRARPHHHDSDGPGYFHPWAMEDENDIKNYDETFKGKLGYFHENPFPKMAPGARFSHYDGAEKHRNDMHKYVGSYKGDLGYFHDRPFPTSELGAKFEYADLVQNGFVPQDISELNHVNWWKKRFQGKMLLNSRVLPSKDNKLPNNNFIYMMPTGIKKRDYTAAQLVNMLKALAKARRQRQIRITGKGLRFGISK